jgi:hypothetical protein
VVCPDIVFTVYRQSRQPSQLQATPA